MKLAIYTQCKENYGSYEKPYWKFKGGETYIVPNLTVAQALKIKDKGIPTLLSLIEDRNNSFEVYVQNWAILDDDVVTHEDYEAPYVLKYVDGKWVCTQVQEGRDYGFHKSIVSCTKTYTMTVGGERQDYKAVYTLVDGRTMDWEQFNQAHKA
jgi:hypothetical protein